MHATGITESEQRTANVQDRPQGSYSSLQDAKLGGPAVNQQGTRRILPRLWRLIDVSDATIAGSVRWVTVIAKQASRTSDRLPRACDQFGTDGYGCHATLDEFVRLCAARAQIAADYCNDSIKRAA